MVGAEEKAEQAVSTLLADAEAGRIAPASAADAKAADAALNAAYGALMARAPALAKDTTLTAAGIAATERAWLRYRDAWLAFARLRYPALPPEALLARLTRDRTAQLADVVLPGASSAEKRSPRRPPGAASGDAGHAAPSVGAHMPACVAAYSSACGASGSTVSKAAARCSTCSPSNACCASGVSAPGA